MKCFGSPRQKRKSLLCKIVLLDDTQIIHEIQDTSRGQDLLDVVCKHLNLLETAYFGLRFIDKASQTKWLNLSRKVIKELEGCHPVTLYFSVKYYAVDPCRLVEEITRYQFFLQLKQDILQSRLPVPSDLAHELFAYVIQSELGDFDASLHKNGYVSEFRLIPSQTRELETRVIELHKRLTGQVPAAAEMAFLDRVKWLELYGADLHPVLGEDNVEYFVALVPSGIMILRNKTTVASYSWTRITKFYRKGKFFMLKVSEKNEQEKTIGFELPAEGAAKHLDSCCCDQQAFFSLASNSKEHSLLGTNSINRVVGLSQRFRGSFTARRVGSIGKSSTFDSLSGIRPAPSVVRVPSKRYQRRPQQSDDAGGSSVPMNENDLSSRKETTSSAVILPLPLSQLNNEARVWDSNHQGGLLTARSPYHVEPSSRHRSCSRSRQSDNESQISHSSRHSRHSHRSKSSHRSHCRHRHSNSQLSDTELSDSGGSTRRRRHRRRHRCSRGESSEQLVDSRPQWLEIQKHRQSQQVLEPQEAKVISTQLTQNNQTHPTSQVLKTLSKSQELDNNSTNHRKESNSLKNSMRSKNFVPDEVRRFIEENLVDSPATVNVSNDLMYTQVEPDDKFLQIRYSPTSGKAKCKLTSHPDNESSPLSDPVYSNIHGGLKNHSNATFTSRSAGSRAPVCVDSADLDLAFDAVLPPRATTDHEMATEL